jgi:uroporphyrinogen-III synthase/uroporphyrinogen III methyltransferase/synthase
LSIDTLAALRGRRILVTRAAHQAGKLSDALRSAGAEVIEVPVLEIRPPESLAPLDAALRQLAQYDWLVLTSSNTVRALAQRAADLGLPFSLPASTKVAAVGQGTAQSAREAGLAVTLVPEAYVAESLLVAMKDAMKDQASSRRILLARAAVARDVIPDALRSAGAHVDVVDAYRNVLPEAAPEQLRHAFGDRIDAIPFTSSSSVTHLAEAARASSLDWPFPGVAAISIGPVTSQTLRDANWEPAAEAKTSDIPGLVAAIVRHFAV